MFGGVDADDLSIGDKITSDGLAVWEVVGKSGDLPGSTTPENGIELKQVRPERREGRTIVKSRRQIGLRWRMYEDTLL